MDTVIDPNALKIAQRLSQAVVYGVQMVDGVEDMTGAYDMTGAQWNVVFGIALGILISRNNPRLAEQMLNISEIPYEHIIGVVQNVVEQEEFV